MAILIIFAAMEDGQAEILREFSYYLGIERRMSPNTVASYGSDVREFLEACRKYTLDKIVKEMH